MHQRSTQDPCKVNAMSNITANASHPGWISRLLAVLNRDQRRRPCEVLDTRSLSDHLKRDMGFLDGNEPAKRR